VARRVFNREGKPVAGITVPNDSPRCADCGVDLCDGAARCAECRARYDREHTNEAVVMNAAMRLAKVAEKALHVGKDEHSFDVGPPAWRVGAVCHGEATVVANGDKRPPGVDEGYVRLTVNVDFETAEAIIRLINARNERS
jgi:hypothetical protein